MGHQDIRYYAEMIDYCDKGLSMLTNEKLILGEWVHIELKSDDPKGPPPMKRLNYSGIVRWGKRFAAAHADNNSLFKYGIEFSSSGPL